MARAKEPRYTVSRLHETDGRTMYLADAKGTITYPSKGFNGDWTSGTPGTFTLHVADKLRHQLNTQLREELAPAIKAGWASSLNLWTLRPAQP